MAAKTPTAETAELPSESEHREKKKKPSGDGTPVIIEAESKAGPSKLTSRERVLAFILLAFWLNLFAGGMLVDTQPYRCAISWSGVEKIGKTVQDHPCNAFWVKHESRAERVFYNGYGVPRPTPSTTPTIATSPGAQGNAAATGETTGTAGAASATATQSVQGEELPVAGVPTGKLVWPWVVTILFYTPLNLAFISAAAGALGTLGSIANLNADQEGDDKRDKDDGATFFPRDRTNPLISGLLRGIFVYLFVISGMLLFDDSPSDTGPNQYVRLAGFLSLFSFFVNYKPSVFSSMLDGAHRLISARGKAGAADESAGRRDAELLQAVNRKLGEFTEQIAKQVAEQVAKQDVTASIPTPDGPFKLSVGQQQGHPELDNPSGGQSGAPAAADGSARKTGHEGNGSRGAGG